jgi:hypothetical protein
LPFGRSEVPPSSLLHPLRSITRSPPRFSYYPRALHHLSSSSRLLASPSRTAPLRTLHPARDSMSAWWERVAKTKPSISPVYPTPKTANS